MATRVLCTGCGREADDPGDVAVYRCGHCGGSLIRLPVPKPTAFDRRFAATVVGFAVGAVLGGVAGVAGALLGALLGGGFGLLASWREA